MSTVVDISVLRVNISRSQARAYLFLWDISDQIHYDVVAALISKSDI